MPRMWRIDARRRRRRFMEVIARLTHNLAIAHLNGSYYVAGGRYRPHENVLHADCLPHQADCLPHQVPSA
jgi:hypothetical protein